MSHEEIIAYIYDRKTVSELWFLRKYLICWRTSFFTVVISLNTDVLLCWKYYCFYLQNYVEHVNRAASGVVTWQGEVCTLTLQAITILWLDSWHDFKTPLPTYPEVVLLNWQQKTFQSWGTKIWPLCRDHVKQGYSKQLQPKPAAPCWWKFGQWKESFAMDAVIYPKNTTFTGKSSSGSFVIVT